MTSGEPTISSDALNLIFVVLLNGPIGIYCCWRLLPRLSTAARWLAIGMLAAQLTVVFLSLANPPSASADWWLWDLSREFNIASTLASTQLALVAGVALLTAWLSRKQATWQPLYLIGLGLVFLFLAWDEYYTVHEQLNHWKRYYVTLGGMIALATIMIALRSPRYTRKWYVCLFIGLAISGTGATVFELFPPACGDLGWIRLDGCLDLEVWEESAEFAGTWLILVAMVGLLMETLPRPTRVVSAILWLLSALWLLLLIINSTIPRLALQLLAKPASVKFESAEHLRGFRLDTSGGAARLVLYTSAKRGIHAGVTYSLRLVDQVTAEAIAGRNKKAEPRVNFWMLKPGASPIFQQRIEVAFPAQAPVNRAFWIVLSLLREADAGDLEQRILSSDRQLLDDSQVVLGELVLPAVTADSSAAPLAEFDNEFTLGLVDLPERAQAGGTFTVVMTWRSNVDGSEDHLQFLHFEHDEAGASWTYDQEPLGARLPTRLWYDGLADGETWHVPLPADAAPGSYSVFTGLYRSRDRERVPASDADGAPWLDARVPLGNLIIEN